MRMRMRMRRTDIVVLLCLCTPGMPSAAQVTPAGRQFQVNTYTYDVQTYPAVSSDDRGNFVVVWSSYAQDYYYAGIFGQRFSARGNRLGSEMRVNTYVFDDQNFADVSVAPDGRFVVAWSSYFQDGDDFGVFAQRFGADGSPHGTEFQINTYTTDEQSSASIDHDASGNFVVVWADETRDGDDFGVFGRRFASDGTPRGTEFQVNTYTSDYQGSPRVAVGRNGDFVVTWTSDGQDEFGYGVFAQRFGSDGERLGGELQVNTYTMGDQQAARVAALPDAFVVAWQDLGRDGSSDGVFARRIDGRGLAGDDFQVNTQTRNDQSFPAIGADEDGNFVVTWSSGEQDGDVTGVFAARFASDGTAMGGEFQVNVHTIDAQAYPVIAVRPDGGFVIVWSSAEEDGELFGNFGQRFTLGEEPASCPGDCDASGAVRVDELVRGVNIALGSLTLDYCNEFDRNGNGAVEINELIQAVNAALNGCG